MQGKLKQPPLPFIMRVQVQVQVRVQVQVQVQVPLLECSMELKFCWIHLGMSSTLNLFHVQAYLVWHN